MTFFYSGFHPVALKKSMFLLFIVAMKNPRRHIMLFGVIFIKFVQATQTKIFFCHGYSPLSLINFHGLMLMVNVFEVNISDEQISCQSVQPSFKNDLAGRLKFEFVSGMQNRCNHVTGIPPGTGHKDSRCIIRLAREHDLTGDMSKGSLKQPGSGYSRIAKVESRQFFSY